MPESIIGWCTHTTNVVLGCSRPVAVPLCGRHIMEELHIPVDPKWQLPNSSPECLYCYAERNDHFRFHRSPHPGVEQYAALNIRLRPEKMREFRRSRSDWGVHSTRARRSSEGRGT